MGGLWGSRRCPRTQRGQSLVEFALSVIVLSLILSGSIEFGFIFGHKLELDNAARAGARWAASHTVTGANNSWSNAASPASNTTEGQIRASGGTASLANDDSHINISYYDASSATPVYCGRYSAASNSFAAAPGYSQATCIVRGNIVTVSLSNSYPLFTGLFPVAPTLGAAASFEVMN